MAAPLIAVIDDDDPFLDLMGEFLEAEGYRVVLGRLAGEAHALLHAHRPALAILDIRMEEEDSGLRLLRAIGADAALAPLPVIVCSAATAFLREHAEEFRALHAETLAKPFALDALLALARHLLAPRRAEAAAGGT